MLLIRCYTAEKISSSRYSPVGWECFWVHQAQTEEEALRYAERVLADFNSHSACPVRVIRYWETLTLEEAYPLVRLGLLDKPPHDWRKTNLVTTSKGTDLARCLCCGATGVRYGLGDFQTDTKSLKNHPFGCFPADWKNRR